MRTLVTLFVTVWGLNFGSQASTPPATDLIQDSGLFEVVFRWASPETIRMEVLTSEVRRRAEEFAARFKKSQAKSIPAKGHFEETTREDKASRWIWVIQALSTDERSAQLAIEFIKSVGIMYEWEGMSEGPLSEGQAGEAWLAAHPDSAITQAIWLFLTHRFMAASECLVNENQPQAAANIRQKADSFRLKAMASKDPLIRHIADELSRREYVYSMKYR